jgi:CMP-N-acetylneuraminic acid synthetase
MKNHLTAVRPVRKGSQRVKNKSFIKFNKKSLLEYHIEKLKKITSIDEIVVNTDSAEAILLAKKMKVSYWKREKYYASSSCTNSEFWKHIGETTDSEFIMFTNCTNPLLKTSRYLEIIKKFKIVKNKFDSLNTVTPVKEFLCLDNKTINFKTNKTPNSQDLPNISKLNFAVNILSRKTMIKKKSVLGSKPYFFEINQLEALDVDTKLDFQFAEFLHKKNN